MRTGLLPDPAESAAWLGAHTCLVPPASGENSGDPREWYCPVPFADAVLVLPLLSCPAAVSELGDGRHLYYYGPWAAHAHDVSRVKATGNMDVEVVDGTSGTEQHHDGGRSSTRDDGSPGQQLNASMQDERAQVAGEHEQPGRSTCESPGEMLPAQKELAEEAAGSDGEVRLDAMGLSRNAQRASPSAQARPAQTFFAPHHTKVAALFG
jgi:hypothetical protein